MKYFKPWHKLFQMIGIVFTIRPLNWEKVDYDPSSNKKLMRALTSAFVSPEIYLFFERSKIKILTRKQEDWRLYFTYDDFLLEFLNFFTWILKIDKLNVLTRADIKRFEEKKEGRSIFCKNCWIWLHLLIACKFIGTFTSQIWLVIVFFIAW